jgi:hypothetical protein
VPGPGSPCSGLSGDHRNAPSGQFIEAPPNSDRTAGGLGSSHVAAAFPARPGRTLAGVAAVPLTDIPGLQDAGLASLAYLALLIFVAAVALYTRDPHRRATALQVLRLLIPKPSKGHARKDKRKA